MYLTGCHKWLRASYPLGFGFYGNRRSQSFIEAMLGRCLRTGELDDPLLRFAIQLEAGTESASTETVHLAPLFCCQGAVSDALAAPASPAVTLSYRLQNLSVAAGLASASGWRPCLVEPAFRTGILLLEAERSTVRSAPAQEIRSKFDVEGVVLTAYTDGLIRLSMPAAAWQPGELERLRTALRAVA